MSTRFLLSKTTYKISGSLRLFRQLQLFNGLGALSRGNGYLNQFKFLKSSKNFQKPSATEY